MPEGVRADATGGGGGRPWRGRRVGGVTRFLAAFLLLTCVRSLHVEQARGVSNHEGAQAPQEGIRGARPHPHLHLVGLPGIQQAAQVLLPKPLRCGSCPA